MTVLDTTVLDTTVPGDSAVSASTSAEAAWKVLILACGALAREIRDVVRLHRLENVTLECLPASLHNRPENIAAAVRRRLAGRAGEYQRVLLGYADCGTKGELEELCAAYRRAGVVVEMMPGAHCYQFFAGQERFDAMHRDDPTAFYLTDYLVKHFERIVMDGLGITEHPELRDTYFGNYTKLVHLAQTDDPLLDTGARAAADRLGLAHKRLATGYGALETEILELRRNPQTPPPQAEQAQTAQARPPLAQTPPTQAFQA